MEEKIMHLLITEDDMALAQGLQRALQEKNRQVLCCKNIQETRQHLHQNQTDLLILDVNLPDGSGFDLLQEIRRTSDLPVILLTANDLEMDIVSGLEQGANDYITKPFSPSEMVARVKAQLRRCTQYNEGTKEEGDVLDFGGLFLNRTSHECVYNEVPLTLTPIEFDILWLLCENRGKVISSEELFEKVWHEKYYKNSNNTVMVHIRHLREKMSAPTGKSDFIKTVWGVGYKVEE